MMVIKNYKTIIFDCDGVLLNSNKIKTQAFYDVTSHFGHECACAMRDYHIKNGGISRYQKFKYFVTSILKKPLDTNEINDLALRFAREVKQSLLKCELAGGLESLRERTLHARWLVVSGGDQNELREVFAQLGISALFDGGVYGSPDNKDKILARELNSGNIIKPALFIGDSKYDYHAARRAGLDFLFLSGWSEVDEWEEWIDKNGLMSHKQISDLTV
jgi:HAD superfamily hydrolase (TIGR01549 family)